MKNHIKKEEFFFSSSNKIDMIHGIAYIPSSDDIKGYIQFIHDRYEHIGCYNEAMNRLAVKGYVVFGHDHMGHGLSVTSTDQLGKIKGSNGFLNLINDTNRAFIYVMGKYPLKKIETYNTYVIEKRGLFKKKKLVEITKPPLHAMVGIGFGSAILKNYIIMYQDVNTAIYIGDKGFPFLNKKPLNVINRLIEQNGEFAIAENAQQILEEGYLDGIEKDYRFNWRTSNKTKLKEYRRDNLCRFEYDLKSLKDILQIETSLSMTNWVQAYPLFLSTYFMSGKDDPVSNKSKNIKKLIAYMEQSGQKNIFSKYFDGYHNLLFEDCRYEVLNNILLIISAVENQQYKSIEK